MKTLTDPKAQACLIQFSWLPLSDSCWLAGGALRDFFTNKKTTSDFDLFFPSEKALESTLKVLEVEAIKITPTERFVNVFVHNKKVQLIKNYFFPSLEETLSAFDFTVCCAGIDGKKVLVHDTYFQDLSSRSLVINSLPYPLSTLSRLQRYIQKGYTACNGGLLQLAEGLANFDRDDPEQNQLAWYPDGSPRFIGVD